MKAAQDLKIFTRSGNSHFIVNSAQFSLPASRHGGGSSHLISSHLGFGEPTGKAGCQRKAQRRDTQRHKKASLCTEASSGTGTRQTDGSIWQTGKERQKRKREKAARRLQLKLISPAEMQRNAALLRFNGLRPTLAVFRSPHITETAIARPAN